MRFTAQQQAALHNSRRRRSLASRMMQALTPWSSGIEVVEGEYVSGENGTAVFVARTTGTAGSVAPSGPTSSDGDVTWVRVSPQALLQFLYCKVPTPPLGLRAPTGAWTSVEGKDFSAMPGYPASVGGLSSVEAGDALAASGGILGGALDSTEAGDEFAADGAPAP